MPRLALVPGEPGGIGPELCVRLAQTARSESLTVIGDADCLLQAASRLRLPLRLVPAGQFAGHGELALEPLPAPRAVQ